MTYQDQHNDHEDCQQLLEQDFFRDQQLQEQAEYLQSQSAPPQRRGNVINMPAAPAPATTPPSEKEPELYTYARRDPASYVENGIKFIDAHHIRQRPLEPIQYLVDGLLPTGESGDIFGPPGGGKTTVATSIAMAIASGKGNWSGLKCASGQVIFLGGERSNEKALRRDLERAGKGVNTDPGMLVLLQEPGGANAIWTWSRQEGRWSLTNWGKRVTDQLKRMDPALVILDTTMSIAEGCNPIDVGQQYALAETIQRWKREIKTTTLNISHTNQASSGEDVTRRLHYESRSGGNGFPGSIRWIAGVSRLRGSSGKSRDGDSIVAALKLEDRVRAECLIAFGVSKHNEMPRPEWNNESPAIFHLHQDGSLVLVRTGQEVREAVDKALGRKREPALSEEDGKEFKKSVRERSNETNGTWERKNGTW